MVRQASCLEPGISTIPDNLSRCSIRPKRFSSPSIYLALAQCVSRYSTSGGEGDSPLWGVPLLFHLRKYTFGLVIGAMCAGWQLAIALDLLLSAHVACLRRVGPSQHHVACFPPRAASDSTHPGNPPPLRFVCVFQQPMVPKHLSGEQIGRQLRYREPMFIVTAEYLRWRVHEGRWWEGHLKARMHVVVHLRKMSRRQWYRFGWKSRGSNVGGRRRRCAPADSREKGC